MNVLSHQQLSPSLSKSAFLGSLAVAAMALAPSPARACMTQHYEFLVVDEPPRFVPAEYVLFRVRPAEGTWHDVNYRITPTIVIERWVSGLSYTKAMFDPDGSTELLGPKEVENQTVTVDLDDLIMSSCGSFIQSNNSKYAIGRVRREGDEIVFSPVLLLDRAAQPPGEIDLQELEKAIQAKQDGH